MQLSIPFDRPAAPPLVFCWGRCGGWGLREHDTGEVPCDVPGCLREHGHDDPHNPRVWEAAESAA